MGKSTQKTDSSEANKPVQVEPLKAQLLSDEPKECIAAAPIKKDLATPRPKKTSIANTKGSTLLPTAYKLDHLKAAVAAAGSTEKLLTILHHVEEAGGKAEVTESIEAYRVLKTVLEE